MLLTVDSFNPLIGDLCLCRLPTDTSSTNTNVLSAALHCAASYKRVQPIPVPDGSPRLVEIDQSLYVRLLLLLLCGGISGLPCVVLSFSLDRDVMLLTYSQRQQRQQRHVLKIPVSAASISDDEMRLPSPSPALLVILLPPCSL